MSNETVVEISLERKTKPVRIAGADYVLEEMDGIDLAKWRAEMGDRAKFNSHGQVVGLKTYTGVEAALISRCLKDHAGNFVKAEVIVNWPVSAQQTLLKMCHELNGLDDGADEASKKD